MVLILLNQPMWMEWRKTSSDTKRKQHDRDVLIPDLRTNMTSAQQRESPERTVVAAGETGA